MALNPQRMIEAKRLQAMSRQPGQRMMPICYFCYNERPTLNEKDMCQLCNLSYERELVRYTDDLKIKLKLAAEIYGKTYEEMVEAVFGDQ